VLELGLMKFFIAKQQTLFIEPKPPFNFELITSLYSRFPTQSVDLYSKGIYERVLRDEDKLFLVRVKSVGTIEKPRLQVEVFPKGARKKFVEDKIRWILGTDEDLRGFYEIAQGEEKFAPIVKNLYGLRAPRTPTTFEALIIALTEQQIALPVAITLRKRLVERYGESLGVNGEKYFAFPEPKALAQAKPKEIRKLGLSMRKAEYIINVSQKVARGELDLEKMKTWEMEKVLETLTKIRGLGPWTVEYMMCRGMGRYEALPANDMGLRISLTKFLDKKERVSEKEVRKFLDHFGKDKGYAAFYLIYAYAFQKYPPKKGCYNYF